MVRPDRTKLIALEKRAERRVTDLSQQLKNADTRVRLARPGAKQEAEKSRRTTLETELRKARAALANYRKQLEAGSPAGDAA